MMSGIIRVIKPNFNNHSTMLIENNHIDALTVIISEYAKREGLVPEGQQLYVGFELRPAPVIPIVVVSGTTLPTVSVSLNNIGLKVRTLTALNRADMKTVSDVLQFVSNSGSASTLLRFWNFGNKALTDLRQSLEKAAIALGPEWEEH